VNIETSVKIAATPSERPERDVGRFDASFSRLIEENGETPFGQPNDNFVAPDSTTPFGIVHSGSKGPAANVR